MLKKLLIAIVLLLFMAYSYGQTNSVKRTDSLRHLLSLNLPEEKRINLLLELADYQINKPGELKTDLDSAADYINQASGLNSHLNSQVFYGRILISEARLNREGGQRPKGKALAEKAVSVLKSQGDYFLLAQAYFENAEYYSAQSLSREEFEQKVKLIEQGIMWLRKASKTKEHTQLKAANLQFLGDLYVNTNEEDKGIKLLLEALDDYRSIHYLQVQGIYDLIARSYNNKKQFPKAVEYALKALKVAEQVKDVSMQRGVIYNTIGIIYLDMEEREKSIPYFKAALRIAEAHKDYNNVILLFYNIGNAYVSIGKPSEALRFAESVPAKYLIPRGNIYDDMVPSVMLRIYNELKQLDKAKYYCMQLIRLLSSKEYQENNASRAFAMRIQVITFYTESKNYPAALAYLRKNDSLMPKMNNSLLASRNYRVWYRLDTAMHNFKAANQHFLKFFSLHDSLFNETKSRQIQQLRVQYETEKKESEIRIKDQRIRYLNESAKLQKTVLNKTNLTKNITIVAILFLFVITGLLYRQFRNKQKVNKVISQTNDTIVKQNRQLGFLLEEKEWLLKEVHHRVKNNLHTIICLLESQAAYLEDDALKAIEKSQNRIYTMSLIHQKLYQSEDIQTIDMAGYIPELVQYLKDSFDIPSDQICFIVDIDQVSLDPAIAIPVALIINEAVTNSIKYAFPDRRRGQISVILKKLEESVTLEIADNGVGMHINSMDATPVSLGLQLITGLTREIEGNIDIDSEEGFKISIVFRKKALNYADFSEPDVLAMY